MESKVIMEIAEGIGEIRGELKGMNRRLDKINGRMGKHDNSINTIEKEQDQWRGKAMGAGFVAGAIGSAVSIAIIIYNFIKGK